MAGKIRRIFIWKDALFKWRFAAVGGNWKPIDQEYKSFYSKWNVKRHLRSKYSDFDNIEVVYEKPKWLE